MINEILKLCSMLNKLGLSAESDQITKLALPAGKLVIRKEYPPDLAGSGTIDEHYPWIEYLPKIDGATLNEDRFLSDNIEALNIIDDFADGIYQVAGEGGEGVAYLIGKQKPSGGGGYILKIQHRSNRDSDPDFESEKDMTLLHRGGKEPELAYSPMIYASGTFGTIYNRMDNGNQIIGMLWWKIMERLATTPWKSEEKAKDYWKDEKNKEGYYRAEIINIVAVMKRELIDMAEDKEGVYHPGKMRVIDATIVLELEKESERNAVAEAITKRIKEDSRLVVNLDKILPQNWLKDFIKSSLYQMGVKRRFDLASGNFGVREGPGTIVWFDA